MRVFRRLIGTAAVLFALPSLGAEPVVPGNPAPPAETLVKRPGALGIFEALSDGSVRHVQSGFVCPPSLPNVNFWNLQLAPSPLGPGTDVGAITVVSGADSSPTALNQSSPSTSSRRRRA